MGGEWQQSHARPRPGRRDRPGRAQARQLFIYPAIITRCPLRPGALARSAMAARRPVPRARPARVSSPLIAPDRHAHPHRRCLLTDPTLWPAAALSAGRGRQRRGPAALLRGALPAGRDRFQLLRAAHGRERLALGPAHAGRLRLQHQGVPAVHQPPDAAVRPARRHPRGARRLAGAVLYYNDVPGELRDELWRRYTLALEPRACRASWAPCISSSCPGYARRARPRGAGRGGAAHGRASDLHRAAPPQLVRQPRRDGRHAGPAA